MGSGVSGAYNGTSGGSQPYAPQYNVTSKMMSFDKSQGIYKSGTGYALNPTATKIEDAIKGNSVYLNGHRMEGTITYVINKKEEMIIGTRDKSSPSRCPHPRLIGGKNPQVKCAGMIKFHKGRILSVDNQSGHYKPPKEAMKWTYKALDKLPESVFDKNYKK